MYSNLAALTRQVLLCLTILPWTLINADASFSNCEIGENVKIAAECRTLQVAEDPANPASGDTTQTIELFIARLPAYSQEAREDPLTIIAGGPGQSATATYPTIGPAFEKIREHRDIILIDQRGTGKSNQLTCPSTEEGSNPFVFDPDLVAELARECLASLPGDPRFYTTSVAVNDLELVRTALGIEQWNIYGISYGTRVALHYLRRFPAHVRSIILDAVVPPHLSLGANLALDAQRSLDSMLQRCANTDSCHQQFPDLQQTTTALLASLKAKPRQIVFENFNSGELEELEFTYEHLTLTLRMLSYTEHGIALLPVLINNAHKLNNFAPLARQANLQAKNLEKTLASGMHHAVICTEDQPFFDRVICRLTLGVCQL